MFLALKFFFVSDFLDFVRDGEASSPLEIQEIPRAAMRAPAIAQELMLNEGSAGFFADGEMVGDQRTPGLFPEL